MSDFSDGVRSSIKKLGLILFIFVAIIGVIIAIPFVSSSFPELGAPDAPSESVDINQTVSDIWSETSDAEISPAVGIYPDDDGTAATVETRYINNTAEIRIYRFNGDTVDTESPVGTLTEVGETTTISRSDGAVFVFVAVPETGSEEYWFRIVDLRDYN
jgi:hypothetical protein